MRKGEIKMTNKNQISPSPRKVALSAFRAGSLRSLLLRTSSHSYTGAVVVCVYASRARANHFAGIWARRLGVGVFVRRSGGQWSVSIPAVVRHTVWPVGSGRRVSVVGGLRVFRQVLAPAGFVS